MNPFRTLVFVSSVTLGVTGVTACASSSSAKQGPNQASTPEVFVATPTPSSSEKALVQRATLSGYDARELITNGSFEQPALNPGTVGFFDTIDGWQLAFGAKIEVQRRVAGEPEDGEQYIELDGHQSSGIFQDVVTLEGATYELRFAFTARGGTPLTDNRLRVVWNETLVSELFATTVNPEWRSYAMRLVGRNGTSRLVFEDGGHSDSLGTYLDHVSLKKIK